MSKIRLHGSSSGYTEIAPVAASGNNTLTLPDDGTILSKDSNGAVGVTSITVGTGVTIGDGRVTCSTVHGSAASLTQIPAANIVGVCTSGLTKTGGFGKFASYAIICDQKATNTAGGSSSSGAFNTRDLNTELADPDGIVSISSNQFTLQAGTYLIHASAPAQGAARHQIIVWNATDSSVAALGYNAYSNASSVTTSRAFATNRTTISSAKVFEIRHRVENSRSTDGLGVECNYDTLLSIYTVVEIYKEA